MRLLQVYLPVPAARWAEKRAAAHVRVPAGMTHAVVFANGVRCEWFVPDASPEDQALLYMHGGGFVFGMSSRHRALVACLAQKMHVRVLMVDYRVAPEHPFPAALDDCVTAYRWLLQQGLRAQNVVIAGDSAGGNLTLTTLMKLRDAGDPMPAAAACLSPVANFAENARLSTSFRDPLLHPKAASFYNKSYVADSDAHNPLISPVFGDWSGLPPLLIHAGEDEALRDDAVRVETLAKEAGVDARLEIYPQMWHVWQLYLAMPQAAQSLDAIAQFLTAHLELAAAQPHTA